MLLNGLWRLFTTTLILGITLSSVPALNGTDLLVCSHSSQSVLRYNGSFGGFQGVFVPAGSGGLAFINGIAYGPDGNLYVSSAPSGGVGHITRYNGTTGAFLNEFVPSGSGGLIGPAYIIFGPDGNLYVSDFSAPEGGGSAVKRFSGLTGSPMGPFTSGETVRVYNPQGLTFGPDGNLYVADEVNVLKYNGNTGSFMRVFVPSGSGGLYAPVGLTFGPDGNLYVGSNGNGMVVRYNGATGTFMNVFASGGGLVHPHGVIFGPDGSLYVADEASQVLRYNGSSGAFINQFVPQGSGGLSVATAMTFMPPLGSQYNICLLYNPTKAVNSGSTIPIKVQVCDGNGNNVSSLSLTVHATSVTQLSTSISGEVQTAGNANPDNDFRFEATLGSTGGYILNLSTKGLTTGTYNLNVTVTGDAIVHTAQFQVKD